MNNLFEQISRLSDSDKTDIFRRLTKLGEEYGEFCAASLEEDGFKVAKKNLTKKQQREHILEEGVDTLIMVFDILKHKGFTLTEIKFMMHGKLAVWEDILVKKKLIKVIDDLKEVEPDYEKELKIIQNAAQCMCCGKIIASCHTHDYNQCGCDNQSMVDGGPSYLRRGGVDLNKLKDLSLNEDSSKAVLNRMLLWGTRGKNGDQPLEWKFINKLETDHIIAILTNIPKVGAYHKAAMLATLKKRKVDISNFV